jgi:hypothetical protein
MVAPANPEIILPPAGSWIAYHTEIITDEESRAALLVPLGNPTTPAGASTAASPAAGKLATLPPPPASTGYLSIKGNLVSVAQGAVPPDVVQFPTAGKVKVWLNGWAMRAVYPITAPTLLSYGNAVPVLVRKRFNLKQIGQMEVPIYFAMWSIEYSLTRAPTGSETPIPPNPILDTEPGSVS